MGLRKAYDKLTDNPEFTDGLTLQTGESVKDSDGNIRLQTFSTGTTIRDGDNRIGLNVNNGSYVRLNAYDNQPLQIRDNTSGTTAVQYETDELDGVLRTPNAFLSIESSGSLPDGDALTLRQSGSDSYIDHIVSGSPEARISLTSSEISLSNVNLAIPEGQSITDDNEIERIGITPFSTTIADDRETVGIDVRDNELNIYADSSRNVSIYDNEFDSEAVSYISSSTAPGTLELTDANLNVPNNVTIGNSGVNSYHTLAVARKADSGDGYKLQFNVTGANNDEGYITHRNTSTGNAVGRIRFDDGEVKASDSDGNTTQLT